MRVHPRRRLHFALMIATTLIAIMGSAIAANAAPAAKEPAARIHRGPAGVRGSARSATAAAVGSGPSFCIPYRGLSTSGVSLNNVYPCANPNIHDPFGYQCVELSYRYESVVYGISPAGGDGQQVVRNLNSVDGIPIASSGANVLPVSGDVISMWGGKGTDPVGHTGVVSQVNVSNGTGTITYISENGIRFHGKSTGLETIFLNNWVWSVHNHRRFNYTSFDWTDSGSEWQRLCGQFRMTAR